MSGLFGPVGAGLGDQKPPTFKIDHGSEDGSHHGDPSMEARILGEPAEGDAASQHMSETSSVESITLTVPQFPALPNFTEPSSPEKLAQNLQGTSDCCICIKQGSHNSKNPRKNMFFRVVE